MIALRGVTKRFAGRVAVDDVSLEFRSGATHVLLGSSGVCRATPARLSCAASTSRSPTKVGMAMSGI